MEKEKIKLHAEYDHMGRLKNIADQHGRALAGVTKFSPVFTLDDPVSFNIEVFAYNVLGEVLLNCPVPDEEPPTPPISPDHLRQACRKLFPQGCPRNCQGTKDIEERRQEECARVLFDKRRKPRRPVKGKDRG